MSDEELRALAEKATPGPWACYGDHLVWPSEKGPAANDPIALVHEAHEECAAYIAAASPDRLLALLDRLARVEALVEGYPFPTNLDLVDLRAALSEPTTHTTEEA